MSDGFGNLEIVDPQAGAESLTLAQATGQSAADLILRQSQDDNPPPQRETTEKPKVEQNQGTQERTESDKVTEGDRPQPRDSAEALKDLKSVVEIDYNDIHRNTLGAPFYEGVRVKGLPDGVVPSHWVDDQGHYFYFKAEQGQNSTDKGTHFELDDGTKFPKGKFYYSAFAKQIVMERTNGETAILDLSKARREADQAYQTHHGESHDAYKTYASRYEQFPSLTGRVGRNADPVSYMNGLSKIASKHMEADMNLALEMAKNSSNPYISIYAADLLLMSAMNPIIDQFRNGQISMTNDQNFVQIANPETRQKLKQAIEVLENVSRSSDTRLRRNGFNTRQNTLNPLHNFAYPTDSPQSQEERDSYFAYWGGSKDQAAHRAFQLRALDRVLSLMQYIELPPNR